MTAGVSCKGLLGHYLPASEEGRIWTTLSDYQVRMLVHLGVLATNLTCRARVNGQYWEYT